LGKFPPPFIIFFGTPVPKLQHGLGKGVVRCKSWKVIPSITFQYQEEQEDKKNIIITISYYYQNILPFTLISYSISFYCQNILPFCYVIIRTVKLGQKQLHLSITTTKLSAQSITFIGACKTTTIFLQCLHFRGYKGCLRRQVL